MSIRDYLEKQRAKPIKERERIAVVWTAVAFAIILVIWIISFREMNKPDETLPADGTSASLNDLKDNFNEGKDSIQNMMQQLPDSQSASPDQGGTGQTGQDMTGNAGQTGQDITVPAPTINDSNIDAGNSEHNPADSSEQRQDNNVPPLP